MAFFSTRDHELKEMWTTFTKNIQPVEKLIHLTTGGGLNQPTRLLEL